MIVHCGRVRLLAILFAVLAVPLAASGCASEPGPGTLTVLNTATETVDHTETQTLLDQCSAPLGIHVEQISVPADQLASKALRMASSHSLPDVLDIDASQLPEFAEADGLMPLKPLGVDFSHMDEATQSMGEYQGSLYGIAGGVDSLALMYNTDLLRAAGITPPRTWGELKRDAKLLTHGSTYGMAFSATPDADGVFQFLPFFWSGGGNEASLGDDRGASALQLWKDLVTDGSASSAVVTWNQQDVNDQFVAGRAAMMINGPWQMPVLGPLKNLHWAVAPIPVPATGDAIVPPLGGGVMTIPRTGDPTKQRQAAAMLNCLNSAKNELAAGDTQYYIPTDLTARAQWVRDNPKLAAFASEIPTARSRVTRVGSNWPTVEAALGSAFQSVLTGGATPDQALKQAAGRSNAGS